MSKEAFIVIEGIDGSGKSTLIENLKNKLLSRTYKNQYSFFHEPTNKSRWGIRLREILKTSHTVDKTLNQRLLTLYKEDRYWNIKTNIKPALKRSETVILDRYYFSTAAYQGLSRTQVQEILKAYENDPKIIQPHILIYLDLKPELAMERIRKRGSTKQIFEYQNKLERVYANYSHIFKHQSIDIRSVQINASQKPEKILKNILKNCFPDVKKNA